ncbi:MAG: GNAT family N-acetyltransferase [Candidatus Polarisedimenticolia bacterium]
MSRPFLASAPRGEPERELTVRAITTDEEFDRLAPAWDRLMEQARMDNPFVSFACMRTAWECFGEGNRLHILVVQEGDEPVAIAPLMLGTVRLMGLRLRRLSFIHHVAIERLDFIVAKQHEGAYAAIWSYLRERRDLWDILVLPQIPAASRTLFEFPRCAARDGFLTGFWRSADAMYVRVRGEWDAYIDKLDGRHRANLRRRLRRLAREHVVDLDYVSPGDDLEAAIDDGLRIEAAAWKGEAGTAIASLPKVRAFYTKLARRCASRGWLRLRFLTVDGRRVAFSYALVFRNVFYSLKSGYDPEAAAHSPFTLMSYMMLRDAFTRRMSRYEFLGPADSWKLAWTRRSHPHCWLFVLPRTPWAWALHRVKFRLIPRLRRHPALAPVRSALLRLLDRSPREHRAPAAR